MTVLQFKFTLGVKCSAASGGQVKQPPCLIELFCSLVISERTKGSIFSSRDQLTLLIKRFPWHVFSSSVTPKPYLNLDATHYPRFFSEEGPMLEMSASRV